jgi:hypothetical protein
MPPWPAFHLGSRARLALLDDFDAVARPLGVIYTPLQLIAPNSLVSHAVLEVTPGARTDPQPIRVLHNGRFSVPAGTYRIEVQWNGTATAQPLGLQIGRTGDAWQTWEVSAAPGEVWVQEFSIPVDAPFIGLRGPSTLEGVVSRIRLVPVSIVDVTQRPRGPAVIGASQSGGTSLFYYDTNASPEVEGFWVWGQRRTRVALARAGEAPVVLKVHSGPVPNRLHVSTFGWRRTIPLQPRVPATVEIPRAADPLVTLEFATDAAFVPRDFDAGSSDVRPLGVWVEVLP